MLERNNADTTQKLIGLHAIILSSLVGRPSGAEGIHKQTIEKKIECGSFTVFSHTEKAEIRSDGFFRTLRQSLKIKTGPSGALHDLDLGQHKSRDPEAGGVLEVDATAGNWRCVTSTFAKDYLFVYFYCGNEAATSCMTSQQTAGHEWQQAYDSTGRALMKDPRDMSRAEQRKFRALGIWARFLESAYLTPDTDIDW